MTSIAAKASLDAIRSRRSTAGSPTTWGVFCGVDVQRYENTESRGHDALVEIWAPDARGPHVGGPAHLGLRKVVFASGWAEQQLPVHLPVQFQQRRQGVPRRY